MLSMPSVVQSLAMPRPSTWRRSLPRRGGCGPCAGPSRGSSAPGCTRGRSSASSGSGRTACVLALIRRSRTSECLPASQRRPHGRSQRPAGITPPPALCRPPRHRRPGSTRQGRPGHHLPYRYPARQPAVKGTARTQRPSPRRCPSSSSVRHHKAPNHSPAQQRASRTSSDPRAASFATPARASPCRRRAPRVALDSTSPMPAAF